MSRGNGVGVGQRRRSAAQRWRAVRSRQESGSTIPLVLGFFLIAALMIFGAVTASAAFLAQRDLAAVCDGAAVAAAQSVDPTALYASGPAVTGVQPPARLPLDAAAVDAALARYVSAGGYGDDPDRLTVSGGVGADGSTAVVRCSRTVALPFAAVFGLPAGVVRTTVASARSPVLAQR
jgi:hypothetical protein